MNLVELYEYLDQARSVEEYSARLKTVMEDTARINAMCELGGEVGSFGAGIYLNACCEKYMTERILLANSELSVEQQLQINLTRRKM